ncbi:MAG: hypothetical protein H6Q90_3325 [Deltaproteobacteria bacterium]|nr:hypothetical protein [Deltaproteobacteria bacterium]
MERYRLGPIREVRIRDERAHKGGLATAVGDAQATAAEVAAAAARVAAARGTLADARRTYLALVETGSTLSLLALADRFCARRRRDLEASIAEHLRAEAAHTGRLGDVELARGRLVHARAEREVTERHFARWRETQHKLAERRED